MSDIHSGSSSLARNAGVEEDLELSPSTETAWIEVIRKMESVYADLVHSQVQVEEKNGDLAIGTFAELDRVVEIDQQFGAIAQAGELIVIGHMHRRIGLFFEFCVDVLQFRVLDLDFLAMPANFQVTKPYEQHHDRSDNRRLDEKTVIHMLFNGYGDPLALHVLS